MSTKTKSKIKKAAIERVTRYKTIKFDGKMFHPLVQAAETIGCSYQVLRRMLSEGRIPGKQVGTFWYVHIPTVKKYVT